MPFLLILASCSLLEKLPFGNPAALLPCAGLNVGILIADEDNPIAQEQRIGYEMALQEINDTGGPGKCELTLVYNTEAASGNSNASHLAVRSLAEEDQVIAILGATSSSASMYAASLANYFAVPMLVPSAGGEHVLPEENYWAFRLAASEDTYARSVVELIIQELGADQTIALVYEDTTFGHDAAIAVVNAVEQQEQQKPKISGYFAFNPAQTSYTNLADEIRTAAPHVLYLAFSQPSQATNLLQAFADEKLNNPIFTVARAGGFASQAFLLDEDGKINPQAEDLILAAHYTDTPDTEQSYQFLKAYNTFTRKEYGQAKDPTLYSVEAYKSLWVMAEALEQGLKTVILPPDITKQREALRQELNAYDENDPLWGTIDFAAGGQNQTGIILQQVIDGEFITVFPEDIAEQSPIRTFDLIEIE